MASLPPRPGDPGYNEWKEREELIAAYMRQFNLDREAAIELLDNHTNEIAKEMGNV